MYASKYFVLIITAILTVPIHAQVHQSVETWEFTIPDKIVGISAKAQRKAVAQQLTRELDYWNDYADDEGGAGGTRRLFKKFLNPGVDFVLGGFLPKSMKPLGGLPALRDTLDNIVFEGAAHDYRQLRDAEVRESLERTASKIVNDTCRGNIECSEKFFETMLDDRALVKEFSRADALGAFDEAQTRAYVKAAIDQQNNNFIGIRADIQDVQGVIIESAIILSEQLSQSFKQVTNNQRRIINNTARIIYTQQNHTIALQNMQNTLNVNFEKINNGIGDIKKLQIENLIISEAIIDGVVIVNKNILSIKNDIKDLDSDIAIIRQSQLTEIFKNSPIAVRIQMLKDENSEFYKLYEGDEGDTRRSEMLANLEAIKLRQDIINAAKMTAEWGAVAVEALNVFCESCPEELAQSIQIGATSANIVGAVVSGNYAGAALSAIGLFKEPKESPELKMLKQISTQLGQLETTMNAQFQGVHEHLFAIEENLSQRMDIMDLKLNAIVDEVLLSRIAILDTLSGIDASLSYIVNQNECQKSLVLALTNQQGQDTCKVPVREYQKSLVEGRIDNFEDLENFFRGGTCATCIKTLFDVSNVVLQDTAFFRYSDCLIEGADNKARPDRAYEFIYHNLLGNLKDDEILISSLAIPPADVRQIEEVQEFMNSEPVDSLITLQPEDRFYRNVSAVTQFGSYVLTLLPLMELHDDGRLVAPEQINSNPGFSQERARKMIVFLDDLRGLLIRTQIQQSLMTGHGMMQVIDEKLQSGNNVFFGELEGVFFSLSDLFRYNPYIRKNYSSYLLNKAVGYERLNRILKSGQALVSPQRFVFEGYSLTLGADEEGQIIFSADLINPIDPTSNVFLFSVIIPVTEGSMEQDGYDEYLRFAIPQSIVEIERMRRAVTFKLGEMHAMLNIGSKESGAELSRDEVQALIVSMRDQAEE